jgi:hypothetical protein
MKSLQRILHSSTAERISSKLINLCDSRQIEFLNSFSQFCHINLLPLGDNMCIAWRKGLRGVWNIPLQTHCGLLPSLEVIVFLSATKFVGAF